MNLRDAISQAIPGAMSTKVCTHPGCQHKGRPQPLSNFYRSKSWCRECSRAAGRKNAAQSTKRRRESPFVVDREPGGWLDIAPWRTWVADEIDRHGGVKGGGLLIMSFRLGISERAIGRWLHEGQLVRLDIVDRCLCNNGMPWLLRDLYPELYDLPELDLSEDAA